MSVWKRPSRTENVWFPPASDSKRSPREFSHFRGLKTSACSEQEQNEPLLVTADVWPSVCPERQWIEKRQPGIVSSEFPRRTRFYEMEVDIQYEQAQEIKYLMRRVLKPFWQCDIFSRILLCNVRFECMYHLVAAAVGEYNLPIYLPRWEDIASFSKS